MDRIFQSSGACFPYRLHLQSRIVKKMLHETSQILSARQWFFCNPGTFNRPILSATGWRRVCGGWHAKEVRGRGDLDREESGDPPGHCIEGEPPIEGGRTLPPISGGAPGNGVFPASSTSKPCQMAKPGYFSAVAPVFARGHHRGFSMRVSVRPLTL